jgi:Tfp pilus assembly protein PilP
MTRARLFLVAAIGLAVSTSVPAQSTAQSAGPYAAAIGKAQAVAAGTSSRAVETNRASRPSGVATAAPATTKAPAAVAPTRTAVATPAGSATQPKAEAAPIDAKGFAYDPEGRRDPFISLLRRGNDESAQSAGPRKPGLPGLGVGEVTIKGTMASRGGYIALLKGADNKTYIVRPGDRLLDGAVQAVTADAVVILQRVDDPLSPQKEREVRKTLRQTEEEAK